MLLIQTRFIDCKMVDTQDQFFRDIRSQYLDFLDDDVSSSLYDDKNYTMGISGIDNNSSTENMFYVVEVVRL